MSLVISVLRSADLLNVQFEFINLKIDESGPKLVLKRISPGAAHIVMHLPAQHVAEQVVLSSGELKAPYKALLSGPSRLAFRFPDERQEVGLRLEDILGLLLTVAPETPSDP